VHCCDIHEHAIIRDGIKPTEALDLDQMYYFLIPDLGGNFVGLSERLLCGNFDGSAVGIEAESEASPMLFSTSGAIVNGRGPPRVVISSSESSVNSTHPRQYCYHTQRDTATFFPLSSFVTS
jgi:hypothetical protein